MYFLSCSDTYIQYICVPVVLPSHLSGRLLRPLLWCWAMVCHPDVASEEQRVQLVTGDFPPISPSYRQGRWMSHTADIWVCVFNCLLLLHFPTPYPFILLMTLSSVTRLPTSTFCYSFILPVVRFYLLLFCPNCSWFSTSSVGFSYHIKIYCTGLWVAKPLGFPPLANLLHFTVCFFLCVLIWSKILYVSINLLPPFQ